MPIPESSLAFERQLHALLGAAEINEQSERPIAWFRCTESDPGLPFTEIWKLQSAERPNGEMYEVVGNSEPEWMASKGWEPVSLTFDYDRYFANGTSFTATQVVERGHSPREENDRWRSPVKGVATATVGRVCLGMCNMANTFEQLTEVVQTYFTWLGATALAPARAGHEGGSLGRASMARSFVLAQRGRPYSQASPYLQLIRELPEDAASSQSFRLSATTVLSDVVLGTGDYKPKPPQMDESIILQVIQEADASDLIDDAWWVGTGLLAGGVLKVPGLLPIVHEKLTGKDGPDTVENFPGDLTRQSLELYITALFDAHLDPQSSRRIPLLRGIRKRIAKAGAVVDLRELINEGNRIAEDRNKTAEPGEHMPQLDPNDLRSVGDALLRILTITRSRTITPGERAAQFDQDILHVEVVDTLHSLLRGRGTQAIVQNIDSLHARYPQSTTDELTDMMGQINAGVSPSRVRAWWRARRRAASQVKAQSATKPGSGIVS